MLRLRTLTFSQPGYRLEMLADTKHTEGGGDGNGSSMSAAGTDLKEQYILIIMAFIKKMFALEAAFQP